MSIRDAFFMAALPLGLIFFSSPGHAAEKIERRMYNSWEAEIGYSQVVKAGSTLYISGIASDKPTLEEQVEEVYRLIRNTLRENGLGMNSIVKQVIYTTDIEAYKKLGSVAKRHFAENEYPSSTLVQVQRLYSPNHMVEIEVVAYIEKHNNALQPIGAKTRLRLNASVSDPKAAELHSAHQSEHRCHLWPGQ